MTRVKNGIDLQDLAVLVQARQNGSRYRKNKPGRDESGLRKHVVDKIPVKSAVAILKGMDKYKTNEPVEID